MTGARSITLARFIVAVTFLRVLSASLARAVRASTLPSVALAGSRASASLVSAFTGFFVVTTLLAGTVLALARSAVTFARVLSAGARLQFALTGAFVFATMHA